MSTERPQPPVPADCDLRNFDSMMLDVRRLRDSDIAHEAPAEAFRAAVLLWCSAWHQVPASSLPNDDVKLARYAGFARDVKAWKKVKEHALRGFVLCSDGLLYHKVVAQVALEASAKSNLGKARTEKANATHWGETRPDSAKSRSERLAAARRLGKHTKEEWDALAKFCGGKCLKCGSEDVVKDHVTPIYQGGSDAIDNLQPLCLPCNNKKGADNTDLRPSGWRNALKEASPRGVPAAQNASSPRDDASNDASAPGNDAPKDASLTPPIELNGSEGSRGEGSKQGVLAGIPPENPNPHRDSSVEGGKKYYFEEGIIRLTEADFKKWEQAYSHLSLRAELLSLADWAQREPQIDTWFMSVKAALAKKERQALVALAKAKQEAKESAGDTRYQGRGPIV